MNKALEELKDELNRTGVISKEFKNQIIGLTMGAMREAHESGKRVGSEGWLKVFGHLSHNPDEAGNMIYEKQQEQDELLRDMTSMLKEYACVLRENDKYALAGRVQQLIDRRKP